MSKTAVNKFTNGLTLDTHPLVSMDTSLTNCLNGTLMTMDGNEQILQNDSGNLPTGCVLPDGFIPIGMKEYNGVIYIVSVNKNTGEGAIGSYPSPNYLRIGTAPIWNEENIQLPTDNTIVKLSTPYTKDEEKFIAGDKINLVEFVDNIFSFNKKYKSDLFDKCIKFTGEQCTSLYNIDLLLVDTRVVHNLNYLFTNSSGFVQSEFILPSKLSGYPQVNISLNTITNVYITDYTGLQITDEFGEKKATGSGLLHLQFNSEDFPVQNFDSGIQDNDIRFYFENTEIDIESSIKFKEATENELIYQFTISRINSDGVICDQLVIDVQPDYLGFDDLHEQLRLYDNKFKLTVEGFVTEPISISYFKYIYDNVSVSISYKCLLYNFQENGMLRIYKTTDGESLELISNKTLESFKGVKTISDTFTSDNEYSFIVFTKVINDEETLVDIQYIVPFEQSIYPALRYNNFRKDINDETKTTGRNVNIELTSKSGYINISSSELLVLNGTQKISILPNEIVFNESITYKEQVIFTLGQYNLDYTLDSYMPDLSVNTGAYTYDITKSELFNTDVLINSSFIPLSTNFGGSTYQLQFPLTIGTKNCDTTQYVQIGTALVSELGYEMIIHQSKDGMLTITWGQLNVKKSLDMTQHYGSLLNLNSQLGTLNVTYEGFVRINITNDFDSTKKFDEMCYVQIAPGKTAYIFKYYNGIYSKGSLELNDYLFYSLENAEYNSQIISFPKYYDDLYIKTPCTLKDLNSGILLNNQSIINPLISLVNKYQASEDYIKDYVHEDVSFTAKLQIPDLSQAIPDKLSYIRVSTNTIAHYIQVGDDTGITNFRYNITNNEIETTTQSLVQLNDTPYWCYNKQEQTFETFVGSDIWQSGTSTSGTWGCMLRLTYDTYNFNTLYMR